MKNLKLEVPEKKVESATDSGEVCPQLLTSTNIIYLTITSLIAFGTGNVSEMFWPLDLYC